MILSLFVAIASVSFLDSKPVAQDAAALLKFFDTAEHAYSDVSFEYEGMNRYPMEPQQKSQQIGPNGIAQTFSGAYGRRSDGDWWCEVFMDDKTRHGRKHKFFSSRFKKKLTSYSRAIDERNAEIRVQAMEQIPKGTRGNYQLGNMRDFIRNSLADNFALQFIDAERKNDIECLSYSLTKTFGKTTAKINFWVCPDRSWNVIQLDHYQNGSLVEQYRDIVCDKFETKEGLVIWLVTGFTHCGFLTVQPENNYKRVFTKEPVFIETQHMLQQTIKFNSKFPDAKFSPVINKGDRVIDGIRKVSLEFGSYTPPLNRRPNRTEHEAQLQRMLKDVRESALSIQSDGNDPTYWTLTPSSFVATVGIIAIGLSATLQSIRKSQCHRT
jgi:hypothetical protein